MQMVNISIFVYFLFVEFVFFGKSVFSLSLNYFISSGLFWKTRSTILCWLGQWQSQNCFCRFHNSQTPGIAISSAVARTISETTCWLHLQRLAANHWTRRNHQRSIHAVQRAEFHAQSHTGQQRSLRSTIAPLVCHLFVSMECVGTESSGLRLCRHRPWPVFVPCSLGSSV